MTQDLEIKPCSTLSWIKHKLSQGNGNVGNHYGKGPGYQPNLSHGRGRVCGISFKPQSSTKSVCHRCGMENHWAMICRTPKHLCDLYQESLKGKNHEAYLVYKDGKDDFWSWKRWSYGIWNFRLPRRIMLISTYVFVLLLYLLCFITLNLFYCFVCSELNKRNEWFLKYISL